MNLSAPFIQRPIATALLMVAIVLLGIIGYDGLRRRMAQSASCVGRSSDRLQPIEERIKVWLQNQSSCAAFFGPQIALFDFFVELGFG
jgi:hypothetical protein